MCGRSSSCFPVLGLDIPEFSHKHPQVVYAFNGSNPNYTGRMTIQQNVRHDVCLFILTIVPAYVPTVECRWLAKDRVLPLLANSEKPPTVRLLFDR